MQLGSFPRNDRKWNKPGLEIHKQNDVSHTILEKAMRITLPKRHLPRQLTNEF